MEPRIQYAKTSDGVNIAFWTLGEGEPFVHLPWAGLSHLELDWQYPECRRWYERLAEKSMLVRYDPRGCGLSDTNVSDLSLETSILDLEAVVNRLKLERFALLGLLHSGLTAIEFTTRHPERVSHLLLWCAYARQSEYLESSPPLQALRAAGEKDFRTYTELAASIVLGWSEGEHARRFAAYMRECASEEMFTAFTAAMQNNDVTNSLANVTQPTLILQRHETQVPTVEMAKRLASGIPNARLALLEGTSAVPYIGSIDPVLQAIEEFLDEGQTDSANAAAEPPGGLVTILFTDMEGSTTLADQLGDAAAQEVRRVHNEIVRSALAANAGSEIKHTGDGIMASFATASGALECAIAIQRGVAAHKEAKPESPLGVYVGLNAGEPIAEGDDLFGTSVNLASRICDHTGAGQILAANVVRELAAGKEFLFADLGETELRGFEDPVKLWELRWRED